MTAAVDVTRSLQQRLAKYRRYDLLDAPPVALAAQDTLQTAAPTIPERWDVTAPPGPSRTVEFATTEGTWMNVDVSPDGATLVFDLLGDIYTMPAAGGQATPSTVEAS